MLKMPWLQVLEQLILVHSLDIKFADLCLSVQGIVRAISSLNSRPDAMQAPTVCVLVTQLIKCTTIAAYSLFLCFADVSLLTFPLFLKICYLSVRLFPCCPAGSLVRVA